VVPYPAAPLNCYIFEEFHNDRQRLANGVSVLVASAHGDHNMVFVYTTEFEDSFLTLATYLTAFGGI